MCLSLFEHQGRGACPLSLALLSTLLTFSFPNPFFLFPQHLHLWRAYLFSWYPRTSQSSRQFIFSKLNICFLLCKISGTHPSCSFNAYLAPPPPPLRPSHPRPRSMDHSSSACGLSFCAPAVGSGHIYTIWISMQRFPHLGSAHTFGLIFL